MSHLVALIDCSRTFRGALAAAIEPVEVRFFWRPQLGHPDDGMILEAAVNGRPDALVAHNVGDFASVAPKFGLTAVTAADVLRRVGR